MHKICHTVLITFILFSTLANAQDDVTTTSDNETIGFGLGALIGGLLAGPPGVVIGATGGTLFGGQVAKKDQSISTLEKQLQEKDIELAILQNEIARAQSEYNKNINKVRLENKQTGFKKLSEGISFSVYFRTGKSGIDPTLRPHIHDLAKLISSTPNIKIHLNAYADHRGDPNYNMELSRSRARAVATELVHAGLPGNRILKHAYGESRAQINEGDNEGYIFDRRVDIHLTIDTEV